ncbi:MFS transporter [Nocardioides szechwanensis]|uniref:Predicted arabinose efflux permease, MFS family n=1 Tax=Nocardioides szechwanensis TaxID=1005944 RepID=A0A1H0FM81_9ACTN|nr:MFS transporter [Nocardioides szechwanensis]GEP35744.1 MFS transporter [Nocardioides szechwanensis]SDN95589.1 Predicted arabinose efflux permease, MFS family [Nocardioides szechwanensis]
MTSPPPEPPPSPGSGDRARAVGRGLGTGAKVTARGVRGAARVTGRAGSFTVRQARRAADAQGADKSGLSRLIELHACNAAADAAVVISLAGTLFFAGATSDARGQVALFLGLTMLPFAIVAPLIGPFLDRFSHGRRWAMGGTFALRGFLCWVLADAVANDSVWLFPATLGVLVSSKAYGVTRAAAVPRLLPDDLTLVKANGRVSLSGVVGAGVAAPFAGLAATFGAEWSLRFAFLIFVLGTVAAIRLPEQVDSSAGEQSMVLRTDSDGRRGTRIPPAVSFALRANCGPRWLSGFLTMFMAFLFRDNPIGDYAPELLLGIVIGGAGLGNTIGILCASLLKKINPAIMVVAALLADAVVVLLAGVFYGVIALAMIGLTAGLAQSLAKVSLDATIQAGVRPRVQASAFARSDTTLQLAWVIGGFVGIALPLYPRLGLGVAAAVLAAWTFFVLASRPRRGRPIADPTPL